VIVVIAAIAKFSEAQLKEWPDGLSAIALWLVKNNWWLALGLAALAGVAKIIKEGLDATWIWSAVQALVDQIQIDAFGQQEGYAHHHRATLFQYQKYRWWPFPARHGLWPWGIGRGPGSGWLVPVIRSGHTTQRSSTYFLAPDDADHFEGVAGHIWASDKEIALAAAGPLQAGASDEDIADYAGKTFISETMARGALSKDKVLYASFRGVPIKGKAAKRWGVLVLDSRDPVAAINANLNIAPYAYCLGKLLERI
jgi:hypothetical protein